MNKLQDITWRIVDGTHLIELTLHIKEGLASEIRTVSMMADPAKLQTLLYGQFVCFYEFNEFECYNTFVSISRYGESSKFNCQARVG